MKKLHYKIYKCYEIVILDEEENEIGNCNYCYTTRADAEDMAKHELAIARLEYEREQLLLGREGTK